MTRFSWTLLGSVAYYLTYGTASLLVQLVIELDIVLSPLQDFRSNELHDDQSLIHGLHFTSRGAYIAISFEQYNDLNYDYIWPSKAPHQGEVLWMAAFQG